MHEHSYPRARGRGHLRCGLRAAPASQVTSFLPSHMLISGRPQAQEMDRMYLPPGVHGAPGPGSRKFAPLRGHAPWNPAPKLNYPAGASSPLPRACGGLFPTSFLLSSDTAMACAPLSLQGAVVCWGFAVWGALEGVWMRHGLSSHTTWTPSWGWAGLSCRTHGG